MFSSRDCRGAQLCRVPLCREHERRVCRVELLHERRKTLTELTDRLPGAVRGALYLAAVMAIVIFGVWGSGYSAQAFIYFQF